MAEPSYDIANSKLLSVNRLGLDTFIVNSISLVNDQPLLALGMENFGIILYHILDFKIVKFLSLISQYPGSSSFYVNAIIPQSGTSLVFMHCIVNNNAVFAIKMIKENDYSSFEISNVYIENKIPKSLKREVAIGNQGYAFIQPPKSPESYAALKFFHFYAGQNSKSLGEISLELNENCEFLQTIPFNMTKKNFLPDILSDSMITAMVCGSIMKIKAFDFRPDITIKLDSIEDYG